MVAVTRELAEAVRASVFDCIERERSLVSRPLDDAILARLLLFESGPQLLDIATAEILQAAKALCKYALEHHTDYANAPSEIQDLIHTLFSHLVASGWNPNT